MLGQRHPNKGLGQVHDERAGPALPRPGQGVTVGVVSVPHTGTHAVMWALGWRQGVSFSPPRGATGKELAIVGHIWPPHDEAPQYPRRYTAREWAELVQSDKDRLWFSPVRDPAQAAWSLRHVHGFSWERIRGCYSEFCDWVRSGVPRLVDIRGLTPQNVKGSGQRDEQLGAELLRDFPEAFGVYYGG